MRAKYQGTIVNTSVCGGVVKSLESLFECQSRASCFVIFLRAFPLSFIRLLTLTDQLLSLFDMNGWTEL